MRPDVNSEDDMKTACSSGRHTPGNICLAVLSRQALQHFTSLSCCLVLLWALLLLCLLPLPSALPAAFRLRHVQSVTLKRFDPSCHLQRDAQLHYELWRGLPDGHQQLLYVSEQVGIQHTLCGSDTPTLSIVRCDTSTHPHYRHGHSAALLSTVAARLTGDEQAALCSCLRCSCRNDALLLACTVC
jgi:hypothetical protein